MTPVGARFINWYMDRLLVAARSDPEVARVFLKVANLLAAPTSLLHPAIAVRVARTILRREKLQRNPAIQHEVVGV